jgi:hypothetical protein
MGARSSRNTTQNNRSDGHLLEYFRNTFVRGGGAALPVFSATGGTIITPGNGYNYHTFTSPGTFTVTSAPPTFNVEYVVVAGGGGGGTGTGGGGGAGGVKYAASYPINPGSYPVTVGPGAPPSAMGSVSFDGNPSVFGSITATGGGRGASGAPSLINTASPGGSGGGGMSYSTASSTTAGTGNPGEGNPGGDGSGNNGGGGGGGAGAAGANAPGVGTGGIGVQYPQFTGPLIGVPSLAPLSGYFGGGGGGTSPGGNPSSGGLGGGGAAATAGGAGSGVTNSGGGGGANWSYTPGLTSGGGGSGIVIIRYLA